MRLPWWFYTTAASVIVTAAVWFSIPARALTDGTETVCQPRSWSDCQTVERFTPIHHPRITDKVGGRIR